MIQKDPLSPGYKLRARLGLAITSVVYVVASTFMWHKVFAFIHMNLFALYSVSSYGATNPNLHSSWLVSLMVIVSFFFYFILLDYSLEKLKLK